MIRKYSPRLYILFPLIAVALVNGVMVFKGQSPVLALVLTVIEWAILSWAFVRLCFPYSGVLCTYTLSDTALVRRSLMGKHEASMEITDEIYLYTAENPLTLEQLILSRYVLSSTRQIRPAIKKGHALAIPVDDASRPMVKDLLARAKKISR